jgi:DNA-binding transcriptional ArsR family regulator
VELHSGAERERREPRRAAAAVPPTVGRALVDHGHSERQLGRRGARRRDREGARAQHRHELEQALERHTRTRKVLERVGGASLLVVRVQAAHRAARRAAKQLQSRSRSRSSCGKVRQQREKEAIRHRQHIKVLAEELQSGARHRKIERLGERRVERLDRGNHRVGLDAETREQATRLLNRRRGPDVGNIAGGVSQRVVASHRNASHVLRPRRAP